MAASKSTPNHVIFKKTSRDKSVSATEMSDLMEMFFSLFFIKKAFTRIDMIKSKAL